MSRNEPPSSYLGRYLAGEHERAWAELFLLGGDVRAEGVFEDAWGVAVETMRRVRANVEAVRDRLRRVGYPFADPEGAHRPPSPGVAESIARFEADFGPLPLSLRAFYEVVGSVDWTQDRKRRLASPIYALGDLDPLLIYPFDDLLAQYEHERRPPRPSLRARLFPRRYADPPLRVDSFDFAVSTDDVNKGGYGGVGPITIRIPDVRADAPVMFEGEPLVSGAEEEIGAAPRGGSPGAFRPGGRWEVWTFSAYLRKTFQAGGFLSLLTEEAPPEVREIRGILEEGLLRF